MSKIKKYLKSPRKNLFISIGISTIIVILIVMMIPSKKDKILREAIYLKQFPKNSQRPIWEKMRDLTFDISSPKPFNFMYKNNSFSYSFLNLGEEIRDIFEIELPSPKILKEKGMQYVKNHKTIIALKDIKTQKWQWEGKSFSGSFTFETPYGLKGRCIFQGTKDKINQMVIARKGSDKLQEGFGVLDCNFGRNVLLLDFMGSTYPVKHSNQKGEFFTVMEYGSTSFQIALYNSGTIKLSRYGKVSVKQLEYRLKQFKDKKSDQKIFLWIEKDCPKAEVEFLFDLIKPFKYNVYEVFYSEKTRQVLARKIMLNAPNEGNHEKK